MSANKLLQAASGGAGESVYVEDVFSTYLYDGNNSTNQIQNDIDLSSEGGMVWLKARNTVGDNNIYDTERGIKKYVVSNSSAAEAEIDSSGYGLTAFNNDGFTLEASWNNENANSNNYVSWSLRKQAGFFDVVTYTGTGDSAPGQNISHNLGSVPGMIIIKRTDSASDWTVYHRSLTSADYYIKLNSTGAEVEDSTVFHGTAPTATQFTVRADRVNASGGTFVAYLFAHDDQSFGDNSDESIIKCGKFTEGTDVSVDLGFEPQWLLYKSATGTDSWRIIDNMRGVNAASSSSSAGDQKSLYSNLNIADQDESQLFFTATGFFCDVAFVASTDIIYVAIRRPMKTPESASDVFSAYGYTDATLTLGSPTASNRAMINGGSNGGSGFPVDMFWHQNRTGTGGYGFHIFDRLRGQGKSLITDANNGESAGDGATNAAFDFQEGVDAEQNGHVYYYTTAAGSRTHITYHFKRATGFFDQICYTGTGSAMTLNHNLGVPPELFMVKARNYDSNMHGSHIDQTDGEGIRFTGLARAGTSYYMLNGTPMSNAATSTQIKFKNSTNVTRSGYEFVCWMFASVDGVSKCGSYTGTGSDIDVDCGFASSASWVLIQRVDDSGFDTFVFDSTRGIVAGSDPYLKFDGGVEASGDFIDTFSTGFTITGGAPSGLNTSGGKYVFFAIA